METAKDKNTAWAFLIRWVKRIDDDTRKAAYETVVMATEIAHSEAMRNAKAGFNNTPGYTRSGRLVGGIKRSTDKSKLQGYLSTSTPYGRIQELGGTIRPKQARFLWVKNFLVANKFRKMTPSDFFDAWADNPDQYDIIGRLATFVSKRGDFTPLFYLASSVTLPPRPYLRPAAELALAQMPAIMQARLMAQRGQT